MNEPPYRWSGRWIWAEGDGTAPNAYYYFRRRFELAERPKAATLRIAADTRYVLLVNGRPVARGPVMSQPWFTYYDTHDVTACLQAGANVIAAVVYHLGTIPTARGGLLAQLDTDGQPQIATDETWRVRRADAWEANTYRFPMNVANPYQEICDTRRVPAGWQLADFDDRGWAAATVLPGVPPQTAPWTRLLPRDIPQMRATPRLPASFVHSDESLAVVDRMRPTDLSKGLSTAGRSRRLTVCRGETNLTRADGGPAVVRCSVDHLTRPMVGVYDPAITLDFGRLVTAFLELDIEAPAGAVVDLGFAERLTDGRFVNSLEGQFAARVILRGGRQTFRTFNWIGFRYVKLRFRECFEEASVHAVRAIDWTYPYELRGSFHCPDDRLNRIWEISRTTLQLCSNEYLTDTPWREQGQWLGDVSAVTLGGVYAAFGDTALPAKFLRQSAANQLPTGLIANMTNTVSFAYQGVIPDYSLWWVQALWNHYLYTGDAEWIHRYYPHACRIVEAILAYADADGIVDRLPYWVFIDWAYTEKTGASAAFNAIVYGSLAILGKMAALKQDRWTADRVENARQRLASAFVGRFFDEARGCFVDTNDGGHLGNHVSEHANLMPILVDLCDPPRTERVIRALYEERTVAFTIAEPFFTWQVLQALDHAGRFDLALAIVRERWGWMIERGDTSTSEEWNLHGSWRNGDRLLSIMRTQSHAWSACPVEFLLRTLLGCRILEAGCQRLELAPRLDALPDFAVTLPLPQGDLQVTARQGELSWTAPPGVTVHRADPAPTVGSRGR